ncbi:MAG: hypothetical protein JTT11_05080 [Candidatus Brockarchaeota archaeon]|nr:hypothetical protein [Candidatus Brockarchaeota archaeon]
MCKRRILTLTMGCLIKAKYIDPKICIKVLNHRLRQRILHKLEVETVDGPVSKKELANAVGIGYLELVYQLNKQLKGFWEVKGERKKRGAREEFIAPPTLNAVYVMLGEEATVYVLDPLANIFGKMSDGTRCDFCSGAQKAKCLERIKSEECFTFTPEEKRRLERLFAANKRIGAPTPMDRIIGCVALRSLEGEGCAVEVCESECHFVKKVRRG